MAGISRGARVATNRTSRQKTKRRKTVKPSRRNATAPAPRTSDKKKIALLTRELSEAREQQSASSEILRVISGSPSDIRPVFDTIVASAVRLCGARMGAVFRFDGKLVHLVAHHNYTPEVLEVLHRTHPRPPQLDQAEGADVRGMPLKDRRAILDRVVMRYRMQKAELFFGCGKSLFKSTTLAGQSPER